MYYYRLDNKYFPSVNVHQYPSDPSTCYVAFRKPHQFFRAVYACNLLRGRLATFDEYSLLETNNNALEKYKTAFGNEHCQWIGLLKKVWLWPSKGIC